MNDKIIQKKLRLHVKACIGNVYACQSLEYNDFLEVKTGLKQGDSFSPILFKQILKSHEP